MEQLIEQLIKEGYLRTPRIIEAFRKIKRQDFVLDDLKDEADINAPLPIGYGQTISQPLTVAFMLEALQPKTGDKVLDIGSGSGWQTALLAYCVSHQGKPGKIFAIERISELVEFGKKNVAKYNFIEKGIVEFICGDASKKATFDPIRDEISNGVNKIIVAAALSAAEIRRSFTRRRIAAEIIPKAWREQLKVNGRIVTPIESSIWLLIKKDKNKFEQKEFPGFAFVPLVED
jgi:protein-L-isoaspartate(D-aspartate) O-methyltransferase